MSVPPKARVPVRCSCGKASWGDTKTQVKVLWVCLLILNVSAPSGWAQEAPEGKDEFTSGDAQPQEAEETEGTEGTEEAAPPVRKKVKGAPSAEETKGSRAQRRFEADVVSKSYYRDRLNGEPLQVDPD